MSKRRLLLVAFPVALLLAAIGYNALVPRLSPPFEAVLAHAQQQGYSREELAMLDGGYSSRLLSWRAYGRFRTSDDRELYLAVVKPTPFSGWRLSEVRLVR